MLKVLRFQLKQYSLAGLVVVLAVLLSLLLNSILATEDTQFLLFFAAVLVSAWYGGPTSGLVAVILSTLCIAYFFLPPNLSLLVGWVEIMRLIMFAIEGLLICTFSGLRLRNENFLRLAKAELEARVTERTSELANVNAALSAEIRARQQKEEGLRLSEQILQQMPDAIALTDLAGNITQWSGKAEQIFGYAATEAIGKPVSFLYRLDIQSTINAQIWQAITATGMFCQEIPCVRKDGEEIPIETTAKIINDKAEQPLLILYIHRDISERKRTEAERLQLVREQAARVEAEAAQQRFAFLAAASSALAYSLDYETTLQSIASLAVPNIADWCIVEVVEPEGNIRPVAVVATDSYKQLLLQELQHRYALDWNSSEPTITALRTGKPVLFSQFSDALLTTTAGDAEHLKIIQELNPNSAIAVPLITSYGGSPATALGVITFGWNEPVQSLTDGAEVDTVEQPKLLTSNQQINHPQWQVALDMARRAALALDNARLYREVQVVKKRQEESLALVDALLENAPVGFALLDRNFRHLRINNFMAAINNIPASEYLGRTVREDLPELTPRLEPILQQVLDTKKPVLNVEVSGETLSVPGKRRYWLTSCYPVCTTTGEMLGIGVTVVEITELKAAEAALRQSEARSRRLVESNIIGVIFTNFNGYITDANDAFLQMFGYTRQEVLAGRVRWDNITPPEYRDLDLQKIEEIKATGACTPWEKEYISADGQRIPILVGVALLDGSEDTCVAFVLDLTEYKRLQAALQQQAEKLAQANRTKDEFLAIVSHEIRSPLNAMLGWANLLRTRKFDQNTINRGLESIERNAKSQNQLIEDLLDVSRMIRGKLALRLCPVNLVSIVESAIDTFTPLAEAKLIQLQLVIDASVCLILGDPDRLQQIIGNLISNAIKFTPSTGKVEVRLSVEEVAGGKEDENSIPNPKSSSVAARSTIQNSYAQIQVIDTGKGISAEFLPFVFDRFRQADSTTTRSQTGLGLGLAIVRHLVELHQGTIYADSPGIGKGATFTVYLPILETNEGERERGNEAELYSITNSPSDSLTNLQILVVDDEVDTREFLTTALTEEGAKVTAVASVKEALAVLQQWQPDVLISDISMPEESGYTLISKLRQEESETKRNIPAIALTVFAREEDVQRTLAAGFQMHISKPIESNQLIAAIASLVAEKKVQN